MWNYDLTAKQFILGLWASKRLVSKYQTNLFTYQQKKLPVQIGDCFVAQTCETQILVRISRITCGPKKRNVSILFTFVKCFWIYADKQIRLFTAQNSSQLEDRGCIIWLQAPS